MRRIGDILAGQNRQIGQIMKIRRFWTEIAGEVLAAHTEPVVIKNRTLLVLCDSPAWAQQVALLSRVIRDQVGAVTGVMLQKVEGKFGMAGRIPSRERTVHALVRPDIDPRDIEKLRDPDLARAVRALASGEESGNG